MFISMPALLPAIDQPSTPLIALGLPRPPLGITRTQSGARATALSGDGASWLEFDANQPRATGMVPRLLIEAERTNRIPNPRGEGAVAGVIGSGGAAPSGWAVATGAGGITRTVIGSTSVSGIPGFVVRVAGSPSINSNIQFQVVNASTIAASAGQVWTFSGFFQLAGGTLANITNLRLRTRTAGGGNDQINVLSPTMDATLRRWGQSLTCNAGTTFIYSELIVAVTASQPIDATFFVGAPQLEIGPDASTPILPPAGTPGPSTRGADIVTATLASLGISL
jgi:hypothetical protein